MEYLDAETRPDGNGRHTFALTLISMFHGHTRDHNHHEHSTVYFRDVAIVE